MSQHKKRKHVQQAHTPHQQKGIIYHKVIPVAVIIFILFGLGIFLCAALRPEAWLFTTAILHVSLADGLAAVIGARFGKRRYKIFDHVKTPIGSLAFFLTSMAIILGIGVTAGELSHFSVPALLIFLPITSTLLENVSGFGTDNITLPISVLLIASAFRIS